LEKTRTTTNVIGRVLESSFRIPNPHQTLINFAVAADTVSYSDDILLR